MLPHEIKFIDMMVDDLFSVIENIKHNKIQKKLGLRHHKGERPMPINIEKNVKIPKRARTGKYPWADMEVGDSFFVDKKTAVHVAGAANHARKTLKIKLVTRTVEEDGVKGVRVWRVG